MATKEVVIRVTTDRDVLRLMTYCAVLQEFVRWAEDKPWDLDAGEMTEWAREALRQFGDMPDIGP